MSAECSSTIFVLTDTPGLYGDALNNCGHAPHFINNTAALVARLKDVPVAGLVLEIDKVMKAERTERDRLFSYACCHPVLRTRANTRNNFITYLDPRDTFFTNLDKAIGEKCRNHERTKVELECELALESDPSMAEINGATLMDISAGGCLVRTTADWSSESFLHLRLAQLQNTRPIYSSIRWTRPDQGRETLMGIMFIDIADNQVDQIKAIQAQA